MKRAAYTLGINAAYHDSAACLVRDGRVLAAAEEERFTRIKHAKRPVPFAAWELPFHAIDYCLSVADITLDDVDHVAYSYDPYQLLPPGTERLELPLEPSATAQSDPTQSPWDPLFLSYIVNAPRQLAGGAPHHLGERLRAKSRRYQWHFVDHHLTHEASAFLPSPYREAAILTMDGRGERTTTSYGHGSGKRMERIRAIELPNSLGLLYEEVTRHLGFLHSSDEYKVMALASYGNPRFASTFRRVLCSDGAGGYCVTPVDLSEHFGPARARGAPFTSEHFDLASSLQQVLEEAVYGMADWLHAKTGHDSLCMAGGVALNCVLNGRLLRRGPFKRIWVQPASGDAGTAMGAALYIDARERADDARHYVMEHALLGPDYDEGEIEQFLKWSRLGYRRWHKIDEVAALLAQGAIIGWFQGRMEYGPRALGGRSILASPIPRDMQARLNEIKDREDFRPVAPVVLEEAADDWFAGCRESPFMLFVYEVRPERRAQIPAVTHVDGTARVQTVRRAQHPVYYDLIKAFAKRTGVPVLVNTSFNTRGEPIVRTPRDAVECFCTSPLDALVIGPFIVQKSDITHGTSRFHRRSHVSSPALA